MLSGEQERKKRKKAGLQTLVTTKVWLLITTISAIKVVSVGEKC